MVVVAAFMTGTSALVSARAFARGGRGSRREGGVGGAGIGLMMSFVFVSVESLFQPADFGLEFVEALLELAVLLLESLVAVVLGRSELLLELVFAFLAALVLGLPVAGLGAEVEEGQAALRCATGLGAGDRRQDRGRISHARSMPKPATPG
jgi:hypothetical protein